MRNQGIQPLLSQPIWPKRSPLCSNLPQYSLLEIIQKRGQSQGYRPWLPALKDDISAHFFFILKNGGLWRRSCLACGPDTSPWRWQSPSTYNQTHFQFQKPVPKYHLSAAGKDHTQAANMLRHGQQIWELYLPHDDYMVEHGGTKLLKDQSVRVRRMFCKRQCRAGWGGRKARSGG